MANRFDLEQEIMKCWNVVDDIDTLYETLGDRHLTQDEVLNALLGMKTMYQMKFDKMFRVFESMIHEQHFADSGESLLDTLETEDE